MERGAFLSIVGQTPYERDGVGHDALESTDHEVHAGEVVNSGQLIDLVELLVPNLPTSCRALPPDSFAPDLSCNT